MCECECCNYYNRITKFIWYYSNGGSYIEIDNDKNMEITMNKKDMEKWAKKLNVEFVDMNKKIKEERGW